MSQEIFAGDSSRRTFLDVINLLILGGDLSISMSICSSLISPKYVVALSVILVALLISNSRFPEVGRISSIIFSLTDLKLSAFHFN